MFDYNRTVKDLNGLSEEAVSYTHLNTVEKKASSQENISMEKFQPIDMEENLVSYPTPFAPRMKYAIRCV